MSKSVGKLLLIFLAVLSAIFCLPSRSPAYPSAEITTASGSNPPFDFGVTATITDYLLISDRRLAISFSETLVLVDLGHYELEADQPSELSSTDETDGLINGLAYHENSNEIIASQDDGDILFFDLDEITETPVSLTLDEDAELGPLVVDANGLYAYVANNTDDKILVVDLSNRSLLYTISLSITGVTSFDLTDAVFVDATDEAYFTTDVGTVFYVASGGSTASSILVSSGKDLSALAEFPDGDYLYVVEADTPEVYRISTSSHSIVAQDIDISANTHPTDIVITDVSNPAAAYAFVAGASGVSVINTSDDTVLDLGDDGDVDGEPLSTSATPSKLAASSSADGYVYMGFATGTMGILSENPWVAISGLTYSSGGSSLGLGESFTVTFTSSADGTYEIRAGGSVDASGSLLTDSSGATSGSVTADTDTEVTINYDDNSSAFDEGTNDLWVFVTADSLRGRRATDLSVDTPPPDITVSSTNFGNHRVYVTINRLDVSDMASYAFYVDTDEATALAKESADAEMAHASSGSTQTVEMDDLQNGTLYYVAMEGIDAGGNRSINRTVTSETPDETIGPLGLLGEGGCSLLSESVGAGEWMATVILFVPLMFLIRMVLRKGRIALFAALIALSICAAAGDARSQEMDISETDVSAAAQVETESPQLWEFEIRTGFWVPRNAVLDRFFTPCCNLITRLQGGLLIHKRYGIGLGVGFLYKSGSAVGTGTHEGEASGDRFRLMLIPLETNFTWRMDYFTWRYFLPYVRAGLDYVIFRESVTGGASRKGIKYGLHGAGGFQINLGEIAGVKRDMDADFGLNDFFLTVETQYQWIDNFGKKGLDLSGLVFSMGILFVM